MAPGSNQDIWLWMSLAALGYYAFMTVHKQLLAVQKAMEITHHDKPPDKISRETEDSIKLDTLGHLTESPNQDIRAAAVRIVVERLFHNSDADSAWGILMRDLSGWNIERRDKALAILRYVRGNTLGMEIAYKFFFQLKTYKALVACLCGLLPDARHAETHSTYRSQPERDALWLLSTMPNDVLYVEEVDLVSTWLAQYPFGGENTSNSNRQMIIANIIDGNHVYDDSDYAHSMVCVLTRMYDTKLFKHQLEEHGLINTLSHPGLRNFGGGNRGSSSSSQLHEPEPLMRASDDWDFPDVSPSPREVEQSPEEQALRRRRREAMVLGESGRPISREDIIERDPAEDIADEEVEEELEQLVEEVMEAEAANDSKRSANDRSWLDWLSRLRPTGLAPANEPW